MTEERAVLAGGCFGSRDSVYPARISYRKILEFFFQIHDPSTRDRQGNDSQEQGDEASVTSATGRLVDDSQEGCALLNRTARSKGG
jgi:peptide methionine sulfoxide reductase MsrA